MNTLSKWEISAEGRMTREGGNKSYDAIHILHLDDHPMFRKGLIAYCINYFFPFAKITGIDNGDIALEKVKQYIAEDTSPDIIITDITHPGLRGHEFIKQVRSFEQSLKKQVNIPILVVTMVPAEETATLLGFFYSIKNLRILTKADESYEIAEAIDELLY